METLKIKFGVFYEGFDIKDNYFTRLLSKRYKVVIDDSPDFYFFTHAYDGNRTYLNYNCHRIFFGGENVRADWNICDYVLDSDFYDNNIRHKRFPLWAVGWSLNNLTIQKELSDFRNKRKFCCMLVSNPRAKERIDFFHKLSEYKKVDSAGRYLNNLGHTVENKMDFIEDYKFVISFENSSYPGYTTEKLIEPMFVNSIPIYWGNPRVGEDFNTRSFVNINDFASYGEAINCIIELDTHDEKYLAMAAQPWLNDNRVADDFSEKSVLDFFDFIVKDSKMKKPVATSLYHKNIHRGLLLKEKIKSRISTSLNNIKSF